MEARENSMKYILKCLQSSTFKLTSEDAFPKIEFSPELLNRLYKKYKKTLLDSLTLLVVSTDFNSEKVSYTSTQEDHTVKSGERYKELQVKVSSLPNQFSSKKEMIASFDQYRKKILNHINLVLEANESFNKENCNQKNFKVNEPLTTLIPSDFYLTEANFQVCRVKGKIDMSLRILAPNVSFDYYKISQLKISLKTVISISNKTKSSIEFETGFIKINKEKVLEPI